MSRFVFIVTVLLFMAPSLPAQPRRLPDDMWQELQKDEAFWYSREAWKEEAAPVIYTRRAGSSYMKNLVTVLLIMGAVAGVGWGIYRSEILGPRGGRLISDHRPEPEGGSWLDRDFASAIAEAEARTDYRLALRLHHLQALAALHHAGLVHYDEGRTDRQYADDLQGTPYEADWVRLSRLYAWSWYGRRSLPEPLYRAWAPQYRQLKGRINA